MCSRSDENRPKAGGLTECVQALATEVAEADGREMLFGAGCTEKEDSIVFSASDALHSSPDLRLSPSHASAFALFFH